MAIDMNMMRIFTGVNGAENDILHLQQAEGSTLQKKVDGGTFHKWNILRTTMRTADEKAANNYTRTVLLNSLSSALGLKGTTRENLLDTLANRLGADVFKREDFGTLDANGNVTSGRPLTKRRIQAIVGKMNELAADEATAEAANRPAGLTALTTAQRKERRDLLDKEFVEPLAAWIHEEREVEHVEKVIGRDEEGKETLTHFAKCRFHGGMSLDGAREVARLIVGKLATVDSSDELDKLRSKLGSTYMQMCGVLTNTFFPKTKLVLNGAEIPGDQYLQHVVAEKFDELVTAFNKNHPELAIG